MDPITIEAGDHIAPLTIRRIDDDDLYGWPFLEIFHKGDMECAVVMVDRLPDLIRALEGFVEGGTE